MDYFAIITVKTALETATHSEVLAVGPDSTMAGICAYMYRSLTGKYPDSRGGSTVFFGCWPNQLT